MKPGEVVAVLPARLVAQFPIAAIQREADAAARAYGFAACRISWVGSLPVPAKAAHRRRYGR